MASASSPSALVRSASLSPPFRRTLTRCLSLSPNCCSCSRKMPPRSVKKAVAKRPSPRSNKNLSCPAPDEAAPLAAINESPSAEAADVKREEFGSEIISTMSVEDPPADEKTMASEIDGAMIVKEKPTRVLAEALQIQEIASENVEEAASIEKAREETVADDPDDAKKVDDSTVPPEIAEVPRHPDDIAAVEEAEEEYDVVDADPGTHCVQFPRRICFLRIFVV